MAKREYMKVKDLTAAHWQRIEDKARAVLGDTTGLRQSIEERERVAIYWDASDDLVALVTLDMRHETFRGHQVVSIYTGNTWIHPKWRGKNIVQRLAFRSYAETMIRWPRARKFWFFGSNSYKSYLVMARNLREFWPTHRRSTPSWETDYIRHLAQQIYHTDVEPGRLVYDPDAARSFSEDETTVPPKLADDPDVLFFVDRNPKFARGAKLMCLAPLTMSNWASVARRAAARAIRRKPRS